MNDAKLVAAVRESMGKQWKARGVAAPVDVLMDIGALTQEKYQDWRFGRVPYLEQVCTMNLSKLSTVLHEMRVFAQMNGWKPSVCVYKRWGLKGSPKSIPRLRFSKSGRPDVEKWYSTHFVDSKRCEELKQAAAQKKQEQEQQRQPPAESAPEDAT